jgi:hypothetical protein
MLIPTPQWEEPEVYVPRLIPTAEGMRVREFMNVRPWKCASCRLVNHGRNLQCADYRCRKPRPVDFVEVSR